MDQVGAGRVNGCRKVYVEPVLMEVELRPDEAVLGFCKSDNSSGPGSFSQPCSYTSCSSIGS